MVAKEGGWDRVCAQNMGSVLRWGRKNDNKTIRRVSISTSYSGRERERERNFWSFVNLRMVVVHIKQGSS